MKRKKVDKGDYLKNIFKIIGEYAIIYIPYKGNIYECIIDTEDLEKVSKIQKWFIKTDKNNINPERMQARGYYQGRKQILMHRFLMDNPKEMIDHKNHNSLDNRKSNLRKANHSLNGENRRGPTSKNKTGFRNVFFDNRSKAYVAKIQYQGKQIGKGGFKTAEEANEYAIKLRNKYFKFNYEGGKNNG